MILTRTSFNYLAQFDTKLMLLVKWSKRTLEMDSSKHASIQLSSSIREKRLLFMAWSKITLKMHNYDNSPVLLFCEQRIWSLMYYKWQWSISNMSNSHHHDSVQLPSPVRSNVQQSVWWSKITVAINKSKQGCSQVFRFMRNWWMSFFKC
jgi:hypothetical protein